MYNNKWKIKFHPKGLKLRICYLFIPVIYLPVPPVWTQLILDTLVL